MKMAVTLQQSELLKAVTRHLIVVMVDSWLTRPHDPWCIYRNGAQLVRSFSGLIAMWQPQGGMGVWSIVYVRACVHFICLYSLPSGMQGPHWGGWDCAVAPLSLSARPDGSCHWDRRWSSGKKSARMGGLNHAKVARPQSHHIWRPPAAGSPCSLCPRPFLIFQMEEMCFKQAVICVRIWFGASLLFAEEEQEEGVNQGWRDRSNKIILFYDYIYPWELAVFLVITFQKNNLSS